MKTLGLSHPMKLTGSYKDIFNLSFPIMIGSAAQQVITLSDGVFLYPRGEDDFASIGFVGVFYLIIAAVGYGFSKGGQIMIARRDGEGDKPAAGSNFKAMMIFEFILALIFFLFMYYGTPYFFKALLDSEVVYSKSLEYLEYRSWGVFFSYTGMAFIGLYTGIARPLFIIVDTLLLGVLNIILNYALINGNLGLPEMGIAGAGLASTIAEIVAFFVFIVFVLFDKAIKPYKLFKGWRIDTKLIQTQFSISLPVVAQSVLGIGSWLIFFGIIDNLGEYELAKANLVRYVYLFLSIPIWGYCSGINTMASQAIGNGNPELVLPIARRTFILTIITTFLIALPLYLYPEYLLSFVFQYGGSDMGTMDMLEDSVPILMVLLGILVTFSAGSVYFNAMSGTGATFHGLLIQTVCIIFYLVAVHYTITVWGKPQEWAWAVEMIYWGIMWGAVYLYMRKGFWRSIKV